MKVLTLGAICGPISLLILMPSLMAAGLFPPVAPDVDALQISAIYASHAAAIKLLSALIQLSVGLAMVFYATVASQIRRIEGPLPILSNAFMLNGVLSFVPTLIGSITIAAAAYRPELPPLVILTFDDIAWLGLVSSVTSAIIQFSLFGVAIFLDKHENPLFPRWLGYLSFWAAISFIPGVITMFVRQGPFAWNGLIGFWIPITIFSMWTFATAWKIHQVGKQTETADKAFGGREAAHVY